MKAMRASPCQRSRAGRPHWFRGASQIWQMEIDLDWLGRPAFEYHMVLPSGREVRANRCCAGVLMHAELLAE